MNSTAPASPLQPYSRAGYFSSLYSDIPVEMLPIRFNNRMFFTYNKPTNYIYKPHSDLGRVGTTSSSYMAQRKRI